MISLENAFRDFFVSKQLSLEVRRLAGSIQQATGTVQVLPNEIALLIAAYTEMSFEERLESAFHDPKKWNSELKQACIFTLQDTPERLTKELIFQIFQILEKQLLPTANHDDNRTNCQLLTELFPRIEKIIELFSSEERDQILKIYEKQMQAVLPEVRVGTMSYERAACICGLPARLIRNYQSRLDL